MPNLINIQGVIQGVPRVSPRPHMKALGTRLRVSTKGIEFEN
jgi:hypothetical protein